MSNLIPVLFSIDGRFILIEQEMRQGGREAEGDEMWLKITVAENKWTCLQ